jgi:hypothetical protein
VRLVITELTEMQGGNFCVAGWDAGGGRMVRPLPDGRNWTAGLLTRYAVVPGASLEVRPVGRPEKSRYPHRSEDTLVDGDRISRIDAPPVDWLGEDGPPAGMTLAAAFDGHLHHTDLRGGVRHGVHVPADLPVHSLGAVELPRSLIRFAVDFGKLRLMLNDGDGRYSLAVSSRALKTAWREGGIDAIARALPSSHLLHIRVGLARPFGQPPDRCYVMVNGIEG